MLWETDVRYGAYAFLIIDFVNTINSSVSSGGVDDIAVIIHIDPLTAKSADKRSRLLGQINGVCVFRGRRHLSRQIEVELSGFAQLRLGIEDRGLDRSVNDKSDVIGASRKAIGDVMTGGIGLNSLREIFPFNPDICTFDRTSRGIFRNALKSRRPSPDIDR